MTKDEEKKKYVFLGGNLGRSYIAGHFALFSSFFIIIMAILFIEFFRDSTIQSAIGNFLLLVLVTTVGLGLLIALCMKVRRGYKPTIIITKDFVIISPHAINFIKKGTKDVKIKLQNIKQIIPSLKKEDNLKMVKAIQNNEIEVFNRSLSEWAANHFSWTKAWITVGRTIARSFVIIDNDDLHYFVIRDFDDINTILNLLNPSNMNCI